MSKLVLVGLMLSLPLAGCRGDFGMRCEDPERYADSQEVPPVRVPDDLSVPSQDDALRIPPGGQLPQPRQASGRGPCLESPPSYLEGAANGGEAEDEAERTEGGSGAPG
jgi:hypothetical protein